MKNLFIAVLLTALLFGCGEKNKNKDNTLQAPPYTAAIDNGDMSAEQPDGTEQSAPQTEQAAQLERTAKPEPPAQAKERKQLEQVQNDPPVKAVNTVKISISGVGDKAEILPQTQVLFEDGDTVFDILLKITRENSIQTEFSGGKKNIYIKGIDNLYEFDKGAQSGWLYSVNGEFPRKSCGACLLKKDDVVEIKYTVTQRDIFVDGSSY